MFPTTNVARSLSSLTNFAQLNKKINTLQTQCNIQRYTLKVETFANRLFREIFAFHEHKLSRKGFTRKFREHKLSRAVQNIQVLERFLELVKSFYSEPEVSEILASILFDEVAEVTASTVPKVAKKKSKSLAEMKTLEHYLASKIKSQNVQML